MLKIKSIKDAVHGYIRLEEPFWRIIDTAEFQRLKWIEQTSYRVLYPSARHDRFIHSIGVYHLGKKAINGLIKNCSNDLTDIINDNKFSFLLACLLHDIGHAPFSHTCEDLYNYNEKISNIESSLNAELLKELKNGISEEDFCCFQDDYKDIISPNGKPPSEHEIMSAIISCEKYNEYKDFFNPNVKLNLDLIVRSILGCSYKTKRLDPPDKELGIKNCLIRLLNSSTVDVDKLDYIARDTQMTGYENIELDTERLLDNITIIEKEGIYYPAFKKGALSIINNVVIAKNSQAQWIVNHPVVIYDSYILRLAIGATLKKFKKKTLSLKKIINEIFSSKTLSKAGVCFGNQRFSLLSDVDILYLMKGNLENCFVSEYFSRDKRKKPIWKSHNEFYYYLECRDDKASEISLFLAPILSFFKSKNELDFPNQIDNELYKQIESDKSIQGKDELLKIIKTLLDYNGNDNKYVILPAKNSFYAKIDSKNLYICFDSENQEYESYDNFNKNEDTKIKPYEFFYLYSENKIEPKEFLTYLYDIAHKELDVRI